MTDTYTEVVRQGFSNITTFAEHLVGAPLWPHQRDFATSTARYRVVCAGRQVGKSRLLAIEALYAAYRKPKTFVLLVSAGDVAAQRLLAECAALAGSSPLLAGSVVDDYKTQITLSNGSQIVSVPASQRQIRGPSADLLIIDEAGFVDPVIWQAAEPVIIARPGSRVILASSPWGAFDHFFRRLWNRGTKTPDERVAAWHWPSSMSPLINSDDLNEIREREAPHYFSREYLAEWTDDTGAYFTVAEVEDSIVDYELTPPEQGRGHTVVGGIDWGFSTDANAVVFLAAVADTQLNEARVGTLPVYYIPWLEAHYRMRYTDFIDRLGELAAGFDVDRLISEMNGPGAMPTQVLGDAIRRRRDVRRIPWVHGVTTDNRRKANGFGRIKVLLDQGRLLLPRHPDLLRELASLTYEQTESGQLRISVPSNVGHDDIAMALLQAASAINPNATAVDVGKTGGGGILTAGNGARIWRRPLAHPHRGPLFGDQGDI